MRGAWLPESKELTVCVRKNVIQPRDKADHPPLSAARGRVNAHLLINRIN